MTKKSKIHNIRTYFMIPLDSKDYTAGSGMTLVLNNAAALRREDSNGSNLSVAGIVDAAKYNCYARVYLYLNNQTKFDNKFMNLLRAYSMTEPIISSRLSATSDANFSYEFPNDIYLSGQTTVLRE